MNSHRRKKDKKQSLDQREERRRSQTLSLRADKEQLPLSRCATPPQRFKSVFPSENTVQDGDFGLSSEVMSPLPLLPKQRSENDMISTPVSSQLPTKRRSNSDTSDLRRKKSAVQAPSYVVACGKVCMSKDDMSDILGAEVSRTAVTKRTTSTSSLVGEVSRCITPHFGISVAVNDFHDSQKLLDSDIAISYRRKGSNLEKTKNKSTKNEKISNKLKFAKTGACVYVGMLLQYYSNLRLCYPAILNAVCRMIGSLTSEKEISKKFTELRLYNDDRVNAKGDEQGIAGLLLDVLISRYSVVQIKDDAILSICTHNEIRLKESYEEPTAESTHTNSSFRGGTIGCSRSTELLNDIELVVNASWALTNLTANNLTRDIAVLCPSDSVICKYAVSLENGIFLSEAMAAILNYYWILLKGANELKDEATELSTHLEEVIYNCCCILLNLSLSDSLSPNNSSDMKRVVPQEPARVNNSAFINSVKALNELIGLSERADNKSSGSTFPRRPLSALMRRTVVKAQLLMEFIDILSVWK